MRLHFSLLQSVAVLLGLMQPVAASDWDTFRGSNFRSGVRSDKPTGTIYAQKQLARLAADKDWRLPPLVSSDAPQRSRGFWSSPILYQQLLLIGGGNGFFYALDRSTLSVKWQFPRPGSPPLISRFTCNPSSYGIAASAALAKIGGEDAVIFGAPDQTLGSGLGDGRLFALKATDGTLIWKSADLAEITGRMSLWDAKTPDETQQAFAEKHEQLGYSAPIVLGNKVFVGTADHCDNPIQHGRVRAVNLSDGSLDPIFAFEGGRPRGGDVWNSIASDGTALYLTTGNIKAGLQAGETVSLNNALSMLRLDSQSGAVAWKLQPVPLELDDDPDWSSGATIAQTTCGSFAVSTMKDGWTYAAKTDATSISPLTPEWQFPKAAFPFSPSDNWTEHGDTRFMRPGASWRDTFITVAGGLNINTNKISNYNRLYGLDVCSADKRVRWMLDVPHTTPGAYALGPVSGQNGFFFVGTRTNWLVVFADPDVVAPEGMRCIHPDIRNEDCQKAGFSLVAEPKVIAGVELKGPVFGEPVLADGEIYVATTNGYVQRLSPK